MTLPNTLAAGSDGALFPRRVRKTEIIYATSQLAIMVDTGITLSTALEGICQQTDNPTLKTVLLDVKGSVESGESFSAALARHPKHFNKTYVALVRASEQTGRVADMLDQIAEYLGKESSNRSKVMSALAYPAVMMCLAIGVTIFLLTYVLPKFTPLFESKGIKLPLPTRVLIAVSYALTTYWYAWVFLAVALTVGFFVGRRTAAGRRLIDWLKINTPLLGPMFRKVIISRSIRTLGTMVTSGVPMLDALRHCADVAGNSFYEQSWYGVLDEITTGRRICESLAGSPLFPKTLIQMIGAGEETGRLGEVLDKVSSHYDREVELSLKTITSLIEPLLIAVMGIVVGGIALSLMLPIFTLGHTV